MKLWVLSRIKVRLFRTLLSVSESALDGFRDHVLPVNHALADIKTSALALKE
jgi:hypothetical protein